MLFSSHFGGFVSLHCWLCQQRVKVLFWYGTYRALCQYQFLSMHIWFHISITSLSSVYVFKLILEQLNLVLIQKRHLVVFLASAQTVLWRFGDWNHKCSYPMKLKCKLRHQRSVSKLWLGSAVQMAISKHKRFVNILSRCEKNEHDLRNSKM